MRCACRMHPPEGFLGFYGFLKTNVLLQKKTIPMGNCPFTALFLGGFVLIQHYAPGMMPTHPPSGSWISPRCKLEGTNITLSCAFSGFSH